jgi:hypothetical protein
MAEKEKWVSYPDTSIRLVWICGVECREEAQKEIAVPPSYLEDCGIPVCEYCGGDCTYLRTEIKKSTHKPRGVPRVEPTTPVEPP